MLRGFIDSIDEFSGGTVKPDDSPPGLPSSLPFDVRDAESMFPRWQRVKYEVANGEYGPRAVDVQRHDAKPKFVQ